MSSAEAKICLNSNRWKVDETAQILAAKPPKPTTPPIGKICELIKNQESHSEIQLF